MVRGTRPPRNAVPCRPKRRVVFVLRLAMPSRCRSAGSPRVSATGDVLELVFGGAGSPVAARAQGLSLRHWSDHPAGPTGESYLSIWRSTSGRLRLERTWQSDVRRERLVSVNVPSVQRRIWSMGLITYDHGTQRTLLFGGQWPGRAVIGVDARLREPLASGFDSLPIGADVYTLSIDRKYGHLLRIEARTEGHAFEVIEVTECRTATTSHRSCSMTPSSRRTGSATATRDVALCVAALAT